MLTDEQHDNGYEDTGEIASAVADRAYPDWERIAPECIACGGELVELGQLGRLVWSRCRYCGIDQSRPA